MTERPQPFLKKFRLPVGVIVRIDGRIPVFIGMAAKKSYLEHRPVKLNKIEQPIPEPA